MSAFAGFMALALVFGQKGGQVPSSPSDLSSDELFLARDEPGLPLKAHFIPF